MFLNTLLIIVNVLSLPYYLFISTFFRVNFMRFKPLILLAINIFEIVYFLSLLLLCKILVTYLLKLFTTPYKPNHQHLLSSCIKLLKF